jgi:acetoin utilization deacetylase AcuC-like enzyme
LPAVGQPESALVAVHEPGLLEWMREASRTWGQGPYAEQVGQDRVVPYFFPTPMMTAGMPWRYPAAAHAQAGVWCYDTMTDVGPGTWEAARAAVDVALTATDVVVSGAATAAYALCRPPGHHAASDVAAGFCYINNSALAAEILNQAGRRVAILDIDVHHGNGTEAIFYDRADILTVSLHADTKRFYPFFQYAPIQVDGERHPQSMIQRTQSLLDDMNRIYSNRAEHRRRCIPKTAFDSTNERETFCGNPLTSGTALSPAPAIVTSSRGLPRYSFLSAV